MGWQGEIFDDVARALIEVGASNEVKRRVLGKLMTSLQAGDWDTLDESLEEFTGDPVIVALFAERGITMPCGNDRGPSLNACVRKLGHGGDHVNEDDDSWSQDGTS